MDELEKEKNKIKQDAKILKRQPIKNTKEDIEENYKIGIEYFQDIEEHEDEY